VAIVLLLLLGFHVCLWVVVVVCGWGSSFFGRSWVGACIGCHFMDVVCSLVGCGIATFGPCFLSKKKEGGRGVMMLTWTLSCTLVMSLCCPAPLSCHCVVPSPLHHCRPVPLLAHMVVPLSSCVSARWFGMDVGWGYSPWHPKIQNDNK